METIGFSRANKIRQNLSKDMAEKLKSAYDRLLLGQQYRQTQREPQWMKSHQQYLGDPTWNANRDDVSADLISVNMSFSTVNTLVPFVSDEDPTFLVEPLSGDANTENATILQSFLNRYWRGDMQGQLHIQEATFDYLLYGDGFLKSGYDIKEKEVFDGLGEPVPNEVQVAEFFIERVNPWDIWIDPYADSIYNARWVCQRIVMPRRELENDDRYKTPKDTQEGGDLDHTNMSPEDQQRLKQVQDWVTIYEFYDLKEGWLMSFLSGGTTIVRYIEHITLPIVQLPNYRIPNSPYHMGELEQVASLQDELNKTRSQMITHRRRNVAKWIVRENSLTEEAEEAMRSSIVNDIISIRGNDPFDQLIAPVHATPLSADVYQVDAQIRNDINELTGVNEYLRGVPSTVGRTATEATIIEGATNIRTRHKLLQVETAAKQLGQLILDIMRDVMPLTNTREMEQFITGREAEKLLRATGADNLDSDVQLTPTREIFQGRYTVEVERGSTELRNPEAKATKLKEMVQMMISALPILTQFGILFNVRELMEMWFEAEGIDDVDALFTPDEGQAAAQEVLLAQQLSGVEQGSGSQVVGGTRTSPGSPRPQTSRPPSALPDETNSGLLGALR